MRQANLLVLLFLVLLEPLLIHNAIAVTLWPKAEEPSRIISLAPNITETLFAVGAGAQVIAVSDHCDYPVEVMELDKVGGMHPSLEQIVMLKPDLVILDSAQQQTKHQLDRLNIATLTIKALTLNDIVKMIVQIGQATGHQQQAKYLVENLQFEIQQIQSGLDNKASLNVLINIGRHYDSGNLSNFYIAGQQDFYNDILTALGVMNVYQKPYPRVPKLGVEGLLSLNPDIIIDIFPEPDDHSYDLSMVRQHWQRFHTLKAIQQQKLYFLERDYATIPGPRIGLLIKDLATILYPDLTPTESSAP